MVPVGGDGERGDMGEHAKSGSTVVAPIHGGEAAGISAPAAMAREMWPDGRRGRRERKEMGSGGIMKKPAVRLLDEKKPAGAGVGRGKKPAGQLLTKINRRNAPLVENGTP
jgi:hypothetical protein